MAAFANPFFSIAGQVERLKNAGAVIAQSFNPFSKAKPVANVENKVLKAGLEFAAANPYTTTAAIVSPFSGAARGAVTSTISKLPTITKLAGGGAALVAAGGAITSPTIASTELKIISSVTPESLLKLGSSIGRETEKVKQGSGLRTKSGKYTETALDDSKSSSPKDVRDAISDIIKAGGNVIKENPGTTSALLVGAGLYAGSKLLPGAVNLYSGEKTREEIEKQTKLLEDILEKDKKDKKEKPTVASMPPSLPSSNQTPTAVTPTAASTTPVTPDTQIVRVGGTSTPKKRKKAASKPVIANMRQSVNIAIQNKNTAKYIKRQVLIS